jgi:urea transporter
MPLLNIKQLVANTQHKLPQLILQVLLQRAKGVYLVLYMGPMTIPTWSVAFLQVCHLVLLTHIDATPPNQA